MPKKPAPRSQAKRVAPKAQRSAGGLAPPPTAPEKAPATEAKAERIVEILDVLHPAPAIPLDHGDHFQLLVAVILSAQTTDKKVNQTTPQLFARAPDARSMAKLSVEEIREIIRELGLAPQKAKSLAGMSAMLVERHAGRVPEDFDALIELPGVGRKTANVVMAQAFGKPAFPVDTHIFRLAHRWGLSKGKTPDKVEEDLRRVFPEAIWNRLHLQIIYFGRKECPALRHDPTACPICSWAGVPEPKAQRKPKAPRASSALPSRGRRAAR